ncbi:MULTISPECIES: hypothetical protein [unclassified Polaromonas]|uniref:hypothetical protein n=1 Tax=unclassified Polaromonas TaxID=2638319 RepID=UPI0018CAE96C|nr:MULTISPECIES: hypothetical protein [unclassified Polaromonas]MBG6070442.1 hypothetical protein [Polaromonas sp. CG_9.7]MBG6112440.1 hypothetical protein [Polaromonas sp. CG_9.2]
MIHERMAFEWFQAADQTSAWRQQSFSVDVDPHQHGGASVHELAADPRLFKQSQEQEQEQCLDTVENLA